MTEIPGDMHDQLAPLLGSGEELLWAERPDAKMVRGKRVLWGLAFLAFFVVFVAFFNLFAWSAPKTPVLVKVLMSGTSCLILCFAFLTRRNMEGPLRSLLYAVTNRRILIVWEPNSSLLSRLTGQGSFREYSKGSVEFLHIVERRDGIGHIYFSAQPGRGNPAIGQFPCLKAVSRVREVAALMAAQDYAPSNLSRPPWYVKVVARS